MKFVIYVIIFFYVMLTNVYAISEVSEIVAAKDSLHSDTATVMPSCPLIKESWFTIPRVFLSFSVSPCAILI